MNFVNIGSRLFKLKRNININYLKYTTKLEKPQLRFGKGQNLVGRYPEKYEDNNKEDKSIGGMGYFLLSMPIISFILGTWQVERRKWKLEQIENLKKRVEAPAQAIPDDLTKLQDMEYMKVKAKGEFLYNLEFTVGPKSRIEGGAGVSEKKESFFTNPHGNTGYWIITPFRLVDRDLIILVNRGWIPTRLEKTPKKKLGHVPGIIEITGLVRLNEKRAPLMPKNIPEQGFWVTRDIDAMAEMTDADPVFIDLVVEDGVPGGPIAGQTRIYMRNEHLSYIITWYSLSGITAWMWFRLFIQKLPLL